MSHVRKTAAGLALAAVLLAAPAGADHWDEASETDGSAGTDNTLRHGSEQVHDLAVQAGSPDEDWYRVTVHSFSSYQFVADSFTGDIDLVSTGLQRILGATVLQSATVLQAGGSLSLAWSKGSDSPIEEAQLVRVGGASCGTSCRATDTYRARFFETTYTIPRFNNSGTQATVLLVQNATDRACEATAFFMGSVGTLIAEAPFSVGPYQLLVVPSASVVPGQSGSVRIAHTCGYGGLSGKAVALEPATGFTFDTPGSNRPH
jgi:hypothetical protein